MAKRIQQTDRRRRLKRIARLLRDLPQTPLTNELARHVRWLLDESTNADVGDDRHDVGEVEDALELICNTFVFLSSFIEEELVQMEQKLRRLRADRQGTSKRN